MPGVWLAAFTVTPGEAGGGTEVSGSGYARVATVAADWAAATGGANSNATELAFPAATGSWGTVVAVALMDAATLGNTLIFMPLTVSKSVDTNEVLRFLIGDLDFTLD